MTGQDPYDDDDFDLFEAESDYIDHFLKRLDEKTQIYRGYPWAVPDELLPEAQNFSSVILNEE